jgi:ADP-ribose pyrophosphatase
MKLIESEQKYEGVVFGVTKDRIQTDAGAVIVRDVVRHPGGAGGLPMLEDGRVLLVRQYRHPAGKQILEIPAGKLERGESPADCAAREIEEEIGYHTGRIEKLAEFYSTPGFCEEKLYIYLATQLKQTKQTLDHDEEVVIVALPLDEAVQMAEQGEIEDSKTIIALLLAKKLIEARL